MATSRTGTSQWKKLRQKTLKKAQQNNQTNCPECHKPLNYTHGLTPTSAEVDHIKPWSTGGQNTLENLRVICRQCNQKLGGKTGKQNQTKQNRQRKPTRPPLKPTTNINW